MYEPNIAWIVLRSCREYKNKLTLVMLVRRSSNKRKKYTCPEKSRETKRYCGYRDVKVDEIYEEKYMNSKLCPMFDIRKIFLPYRR